MLRPRKHRNESKHHFDGNKHHSSDTQSGSDLSVKEDNPIPVLTIPQAVTSGLCSETYLQRTYFDSNLTRAAPPILYSFPGAGSTWVRQLIEYSTGVYTGSVYNDSSLIYLMPGEVECNNFQSAIKVHPHHYQFENLYHGNFTSKSSKNKCAERGIKSFQRAILLLRNPYDSIWTEYLRRQSANRTRGIPREVFDWNDWGRFVAFQSYRYLEMWEFDYKAVERLCKPEDYLFIRYEDLKNENTRVNELQRITDFLSIPVTNHRLSCTFAISENFQTIRAIDPNNDMTKYDVYTPQIVCGMWKVFGHVVRGYGTWMGYDCDNGNYTRLPKHPTEKFAPAFMNLSYKIIPREYCPSSYLQRRYLDDLNRPPPPLLYSFPGAGNTWTRQLIEYATGIYTGSLYNDRTLYSILPGEIACNTQQSVIKVHPGRFRFHKLFDGSFTDADRGWKCIQGHIKQFSRAILLIRDPYDSIWSEFQREKAHSHVHGISTATFDWLDWIKHVTHLTYQYLAMWEQDYANVKRLCKPQDYMFIRYEDLRNSSLRLSELKKLTDFIHIPVTEDRLRCAFSLSENNASHRTIDPNVEMTKVVAYTPQIACGMWRVFGHVVNGYGPWKGLDCNNPQYSKLQVNSPNKEFLPQKALPHIDSTNSPTFALTNQPNISPTFPETSNPTIIVSVSPTYEAINTATSSSTMIDSLSPSTYDSASPTFDATIPPTISITESPSISNSLSPTMINSLSPTVYDTATPTISNSVSPTAFDSVSPTVINSVSPTIYDTASPSFPDTHVPTASDTTIPTTYPTAHTTITHPDPLNPANMTVSSTVESSNMQPNTSPLNGTVTRH